MEPKKETTNDFDYVAYDDLATADQKAFKEKFVELQALAASTIKCQRSKALVKTKLEEAYMWVGKGIRNDQIARGDAPLQESRNNG